MQLKLKYKRLKLLYLLSYYKWYMLLRLCVRIQELTKYLRGIYIGTRNIIILLNIVYIFVTAIYKCLNKTCQIKSLIKY